jgi:hypothetical protein
VGRGGRERNPQTPVRLRSLTPREQLVKEREARLAVEERLHANESLLKALQSDLKELNVQFRRSDEVLDAADLSPTGAASPSRGCRLEPSECTQLSRALTRIENATRKR